MYHVLEIYSQLHGLVDEVYVFSVVAMRLNPQSYPF